MKIQFLQAAVVASLSVGVNALGASKHQICSDSTGVVSVENGNVSIKDGIGNVGPAKLQKVLRTISTKHENCVEGPNYRSTIITVEKVTYDLEEGVTNSAIVLCTHTLTGIVPPGTKCN